MDVAVRILEGIGIALLAVLAILCALFVRRSIIARGGGTIELSVRLSTMVPGRGWAVGVGRFSGDELRWYRLFSLSLRPRRVLSRRSLSIEQRRLPDERERLVLPADWTIVRCGGPQGPVEIAMAVRTVAGFLSWVESAPPGAFPADPPSRWSKAS